MRRQPVPFISLRHATKPVTAHPTVNLGVGIDCQVARLHYRFSCFNNRIYIYIYIYIYIHTYIHIHKQTHTHTHNTHIDLCERKQIFSLLK